MLIKRSLLVLVVALGLTSPAPLGAASALVGQAVAVDGDTLDLGGQRVRLHGVDAPEHDQTCARADGRVWACGAWARAQLAAELSRGRVACDDLGADRYGRRLATCQVAGRDIGAVLVRAGAARAYRRYSDLYIGDEQAAAARGQGIWAGAHQSPEGFRASRRPQPVAAPVKGCALKGNVSDAGRIYHRPGQRDYDKVQISAAKGERWFCSAAEAEAAGWRAARR